MKKLVLAAAFGLLALNAIAGAMQPAAVDAAPQRIQIAEKSKSYIGELLAPLARAFF